MKKSSLTITHWVYGVALLIVATILVTAITLRWWKPDLQQFSFFDPLIGWLGLFLSLVAISPLLYPAWVDDKMATRIIFVSILILAAYQLFLIVRVIALHDIPGDFRICFEAAQTLYVQKQSPYEPAHVVAAAFPFPTYFVYWLVSLGSSLSIESSFLLYSGINVALWVTLNVILWRYFHIQTTSSVANSLLILCMLNSTGWEAFLAMGQTTILVLFLVVSALVCFGKQRAKLWFWGGVLLGIATMIKPQVLILSVGLGILLISRLIRGRSIFNVVSALLGVAGIVAALIGISLFFPPGLNLNIYRQWLFEIYPAVNNPAMIPYTGSFGVIHGNASLIALVVQIAAWFGVVPSSISYTLIMIVGLGLFAYWIYRHIDTDLSMKGYLLIWLFGIVLLTPLTHTYSAVWVTPVLLVLLRDLFDQLANPPLILLAMFSYAVLRVQIPILTVASLFVLLAFAFKSLRREALSRGDSSQRVPASATMRT